MYRTLIGNKQSRPGCIAKSHAERGLANPPKLSDETRTSMAVRRKLWDEILEMRTPKSRRVFLNRHPLEIKSGLSLVILSVAKNL
jgi:hypothetical protein